MRIHETANAFFNGEKYIQDFIDYWKVHAFTFGKGHAAVFNESNLLDKFSITSTGGQNYINTDWKLNIIDHVSTKFPFKMGRVSAMRLHMNRLASLENMPSYVGSHFHLEGTNGTANTVLTSMVGGPEHAQSFGFTIANPLESLQTSLKYPIDDMWIHAPEILSFAGMNVRCKDLTINVPFQKSISGIHKQLRNVENLTLNLPPNFEGGVLGLAMIPGLQGIVGSSVGQQSNYSRALELLSKCKLKGMNIHDIQEEMIDSGLKAFATL